MKFLLLLAAVGVVPWLWLRHMKRRHGPGPLFWRWMSGHPLDGYHRTNATWLRRGDKVLHPTGRVVRWHYLPRLHRAGIRGGSTIGLLALAIGLVKARGATLLILAVVGFVAVGLLVWRVYYLLRRWQHHYTYVRPLTRAVTPMLGAPPPRLAIEPDRSKIVLGLPEEFTGDDRDKANLLRAVTVKLGIEAPDATWRLDSKRPQVTFVKGIPPPARAGLPAIRDAIGRADEHEIIMGLGRKDQVTVVSVDNDSPHVGLSMGSGDGKSTVAKNMLAQMLFHGGLGVVLDYKLISHMWARDLPNVSYAGTPAEIEAALVWLAGEVTRRNQVALAGADIEGEVHASVGPRILLIAEELNATQNRLKAWWNREMGEKGRSPGSEALDEVMFLGRQVHINVLQIGQRLSVKASGSGDARENLGVLIFADPTASAWKMLVGDRHVLPPATGHRGRLQVVTRREVRETQGAYLTGAEARQLATAGTVALPPAGMPGITVPARVPVGAGQTLVPLQQPPDLGNVVQHAPLLPPRDPGTVTLKEAVEAGMWPTIHAARQAKQRHKPTPVGTIGSADLFRIEDLVACRIRKRP